MKNLCVSQLVEGLSRINNCKERLELYIISSLWHPGHAIVVHCCSVAKSCLPLCDPCTVACQASLSFAISRNLLKFMSIESVMPSSQLILCHPFSSCLQSFPVSGSFPMSQFCTSGGLSIGVSASASVLPMNIQHWFPLGLTVLISF